MQISVSFTTRNIERLLKDIDNKVVPRALPTAINKTLLKGRTKAVRDVSQDAKVKAKTIRGRTSIKKARRNKPKATFYIGILPIRASDLGKPRQLKTTARVGKHDFPDGFVATMPSGHVSIFKRKGQGRLPIKEQTVKLDGADKIAKRAFRHVMRTDFPRIFHHEVKRQLSRSRGFR